MSRADLEASGIISRSVPKNIYNRHGYFAYNLGDTATEFSNRFEISSGIILRF